MPIKHHGRKHMRTWKHLGLMTAAAVVFAATPVLAGAAEYKEMMQSFIGDWVVNGTTPQGMPSVPAGVKYTMRQGCNWNATGDAIVVDWDATTVDGKLFQIGSGVLSWDNDSQSMTFEFSGRVGGNHQFHGSAKSTSCDGTSASWKGHQTDSEGTTMWFTKTDDMSGGKWNSTIDFCDKNWKPMGHSVKLTFEKYNNFVGNAGSIGAIIGTWEAKKTDSQGNTTTQMNMYEWGPGKRCIIGRYYETSNGKTAFIGTETIYWNADAGQIQGSYWDDDGVNITWATNEISENGSMVTWAVAYWGHTPDGMPINGSATFSMQGTNTMRLSFNEAWYAGQMAPANSIKSMDQQYTRTSNTVANVKTN